MNFTRSLKVTIEHKGNRPQPEEEAWYIERTDFYSSIAYWYQTGEAKRFGHLPSFRERCVPWHTENLVRTFTRCKASRGTVKVEPTGHFGGRPSIRWENSDTDATWTLPFTVPEDGRYALRVTAFTGPDSGTYDVEIDGEPVRRGMSVTSDARGEEDLLIGTSKLAAADHTLTFRAVGALDGPESLTLELVRLLRLPAEIVREPKTHNEAHSVRLRVGRALYAYRLAYGELPPSLAKLVECGLMPPHFLNDENGYPLLARVEGECFAFDSTAPGGWNHRLQGLDARR